MKNKEKNYDSILALPVSVIGIAIFFFFHQNIYGLFLSIIIMIWGNNLFLIGKMNNALEKELSEAYMVMTETNNFTVRMIKKLKEDLNEKYPATTYNKKF